MDVARYCGTYERKDTFVDKTPRSPEKALLKPSQLLFDTGTEVTQGEKAVTSGCGDGTTKISRQNFTFSTKKIKWTTDLNFKR